MPMPLKRSGMPLFFSVSSRNIGILLRLTKNVNIFDVIYQPLETKLILLSRKCGLNHMNGLKMNLEQAVLAFIHANPEFSNLQEIRSSMLSID